MTFRVLTICAAVGLMLAACHKTEAPKPDQSAPSKAFLAKTAKEPGVHTLPSGLEYKVVHEGPASGLRPHLNDEVKIMYEGKLVDGTVFDSSYERGQPSIFTPRSLIKGWQEALQLMRPGDEWILYVPPDLGYGAEGNEKIPPGSALVFRLELIDVLPGPGTVQAG
jgi:peptidylprolyl isomerase/FKBP-type peptidyl-prolyl cis-trans isomerase FklB